MHTFTLTDADGQQHSYSVDPHTPTDGFGVCSRVAAAVIDPLAGTALAALAKTVPLAIRRGVGSDGKLDVAAIMDDPEIVEALSGLDFANAGKGLRRAVESIDLHLVRDILRHTNRGGKPLSSDLHFDTAYQRNYGEMFKAAWKVGGYNRFFELLDGFGALVQTLRAQVGAAQSSDGPPKTA